MAFRRSLAVTIRLKSTDHWPVEVILHERPRTAPIIGAGRFAIDPADLEIQGDPKLYGEALGKALFTDAVRDLYLRGRHGDGPLHFMLSVDPPELRPLQWERLCGPRSAGMDFVVFDQRVAYARYIPSPVMRSFRELDARALRALVVVSNPEPRKSSEVPEGSAVSRDYGLARFDAEAAVAAAREGLGEIPCTVLGPVKDSAGPASLDAICDGLTGGGFTLLHVIAHGRLSNNPNAEKKVPLLFLSDAAGVTEVVDKHRFIDRLGDLADGLPHFMFFAACESGVDGEDESMGGLARGLVGDLGVPAVLAMNSRISVATAEALSRAFYRRLLVHGHVDQALVEANAGLCDRKNALVPALYSRLGPLPLFSAVSGQAPGVPEPEWSRADMRAWSIALQQAITRRDHLHGVGSPTDSIDSEISGIRHRMRQDGQLHAGDVLGGRYLLLSLVGEGLSSSVWRAHDRLAKTKDDIALKILHPQHTRHPSLVRQFRRAAERARSLDHPNIVRVLGPVEEEQGRVYLPMELMAGGTLQEAVRRRRVGADGVLSVVQALAGALSYAHGRDLFHRDVEPTNVLFDANGVPKLADFDMSFERGKIVDTGVSFISPAIYIAPECHAAHPEALPESDVFGLAMTTLFMYTGVPPAEALSAPRRFFARLPCPPHARRALRRAIALDARARFRSVADFHAALTTPPRAMPWPTVALVALIVVSLVVLLVKLT